VTNLRLCRLLSSVHLFVVRRRLSDKSSSMQSNVECLFVVRCRSSDESSSTSSDVACR